MKRARAKTNVLDLYLTFLEAAVCVCVFLYECTFMVYRWKPLMSFSNANFYSIILLHTFSPVQLLVTKVGYLAREIQKVSLLLPQDWDYKSQIFNRFWGLNLHLCICKAILLPTETSPQPLNSASCVEKEMFAKK